MRLFRRKRKKPEPLTIGEQDTLRMAILLEKADVRSTDDSVFYGVRLGDVRAKVRAWDEYEKDI